MQRQYGDIIASWGHNFLNYGEFPSWDHIIDYGGLWKVNTSKRSLTVSEEELSKNNSITNLGFHGTPCLITRYFMVWPQWSSHPEHWT